MVTLDYLRPLTPGLEMLEFWKGETSFPPLKNLVMTPQIQTALWISHPVLQVAVAATMVRRKLHRTFPVFFTYLAAQIAIFCVLFPIQRLASYSVYFYGYWICAGISLALGFKVIYEIFQDVFRPYHALKDLGSVLFKWSGLVMLLAAVVIAAASPNSEQGAVIEAMLVLQRGVRVIHCGLILFLLVFARYLGVSWKQNSFGIALGFGSYAAAELGAFALYSSGRISANMVSAVDGISYSLAIMIWFGYSALRSAPRAESFNLLTSQRWNQSLADLQNPVGGDSLIPMFEGMVDRAFSRTGEPTFMTSQRKQLPALYTHPASELGSAHFQPANFPAALTAKF